MAKVLKYLRQECITQLQKENPSFTYHESTVPYAKLNFHYLHVKLPSMKEGEHPFTNVFHSLDTIIKRAIRLPELINSTNPEQEVAWCHEVRKECHNRLICYLANASFPY